MAFVLEHGLRTDCRTAQALVDARATQRLTLADFQHRAEALRMFGWPLEGLATHVFSSGLTTKVLPRLAYVAEHACASQPSVPAIRAILIDCVGCQQVASTCFEVNLSHQTTPHHTTSRHNALAFGVIRPASSWFGAPVPGCRSNRVHRFKAVGQRFLVCDKADVENTLEVTGQSVCRPDWDGSLRLLMGIAASKVPDVVSAQASFVEFKESSGAAAIDAALMQLNARLAARGAPFTHLSCIPGGLGCSARVSQLSWRAALWLRLPCAACTLHGWPRVPFKWPRGSGCVCYAFASRT